MQTDGVLRHMFHTCMNVHSYINADTERQTDRQKYRQVERQAEHDEGHLMIRFVGKCDLTVTISFSVF
jgi:hypothetical protein